ncbi:MAG TPA: hypothetical protein VGQ99_23430 [Tepidisphaeraceae bacterium]|jgi:hypothetical protein|nr:hypothetical protein [Tepidisphaeraceae bacterium]
MTKIRIDEYIDAWRTRMSAPPPLTLTLSPEYGGEGIREEYWGEEKREEYGGEGREGQRLVNSLRKKQEVERQ